MSQLRLFSPVYVMILWAVFVATGARGITTGMSILLGASLLLHFREVIAIHHDRVDRRHRA